MISTSTGIEFAGISSNTIGFLVAHIDTQSYQIGINSEIVFDKVKFSDNIYYQGKVRQPLEFNLQLFKSDGTQFTIKDRMDINSWLDRDKFEDLIFSNPQGINTPQVDMCEDIVFECITNGKIESIDYGGLVGISVPFLCSKAYATTKENTQYFDMREIGATPTLIAPALENKSNIVTTYFWDSKLTIELATGVTSVILQNINDSGKIISFTGCNAGDTIELDNKLGILTALTTPDIFSKWNKNLLGMVNGLNNILVTGACEITVKAKYPVVI